MREPIIEKQATHYVDSEDKRKKDVEYYLSILDIKLVDTGVELKSRMCFVVTENYTVIVTPRFHEHLFEKYGINPDRTLTEGYIGLNKDGTIGKIDFKLDVYQINEQFDGTPHEKAQMKMAVRRKIRQTLKIK